MYGLRCSTAIAALVAPAALVTLSACGGGNSVNSAGSVAMPSGSATAPVSAAPPAPTPAPAPAPAPAYAAQVAPPPGYVVTPADMQPMRSTNDTAEYRQNYVANEMVNALYARDRGWTGQGVVVGVIDDGVATDLPAFAGRIAASSKDFGYVTRNGVKTRRDALGDAQSDHGTAAAGIIAARADGTGTVGLAPDAGIAVLRTSDYDADTGRETLLHDAEAIDHAAGAGIRIVSRSLASNGAGLADAVARYGATGGLLVNAAGNAGQASPADAINVTAANQDAWLFVVALDPDLHGYALAGYSNQAGSMAERTVAAIGTNMTVATDGSVRAFSGTSSATPQVAALAALILGKWPQLSGKQAGTVVLATARDIGAAGVDTVYGHGLIDVQAALAPAQPTLSNGTSTTLLASSVMAVPAAMGTGSIQTALGNVTVLDAYDRDFAGSVAGLVVRPQDGRSRWLRQRVGQMADGGLRSLDAGAFQATLGYARYRTGPGDADMRTVATAGQMAYRSGDTRMRVGFNAQGSLQSDTMGLAPFADGILAYAPQAGNSVGLDHALGRARLGLTVSAGALGGSRAQAAVMALEVGRLALRAAWIDETGSVLGVASAGGLSLGRGATTAMVEAHQSVVIASGWTLEGYGSLGVTRLKIDARSVVTGASALIGTRMGVQVTGPLLGGALSVGFAQPLTMERGTAHLTLGTGYDLATRSLTYGTTDADLSGGVRRVQMTGGFARDLGDATVRIGVMQDLADGSQRVLAGYRQAF